MRVSLLIARDSRDDKVQLEQMVHWVKKCRLLFNIWRGRICYSQPISTDGNGCVCVRVRMTNENEESTNILSMRSLTIFPLIFENEKMIYRLDKSQCWIFKWYFYDNIFSMVLTDVVGMWASECCGARIVDLCLRAFDMLSDGLISFTCHWFGVNTT